MMYIYRIYYFAQKKPKTLKKIILVLSKGEVKQKNNKIEIITKQVFLNLYPRSNLQTTELINERGETKLLLAFH